MPSNIDLCQKELITLKASVTSSQLPYCKQNKLLLLLGMSVESSITASRLMCLGNITSNQTAIIAVQYLPVEELEQECLFLALLSKVQNNLFQFVAVPRKIFSMWLQWQCLSLNDIWFSHFLPASGCLSERMELLQNARSV